jgi:hypothetical protein
MSAKATMEVEAAEVAIPAQEREVPRLRFDAISILVLGVTVRLGLIWITVSGSFHMNLFHKGLELGLVAQSLATGHGFSSPFGGDTGPTAYLAPAYPIFIAGLFRLFGSFTVGAAVTAMVIQTLFSAATLALMMHIAMRTASKQAAILAGALWALSPLAISMPTFIWEMSLSTLLLTAMVAFAMRCKDRATTGLWIWMGGFCGLSALVNPALLPSQIAMMGWAAWRTGKSAPRRRLAYAMLALFAVLSPWPMRNARVMHAFIPFRSNLGFELWQGNRPGGDAKFQDSLHPYFNQPELAEYRSLGEVAYMRNKSTQAKKFIISHPAKFVVQTSQRVVRFWTGLDQASGSSSWTIVFLLTGTTVLGITGLVLLAARGRLSISWLFLLPLLIFPLPYYVTHADCRFRLLLDPILTILTAHAIVSVLSRKRQADQPDAASRAGASTD